MNFISSKYSKEKIIDKLSNYDWNNISQYQKLSEDFIQEFKDCFKYYFSVSIYLLKEDFIKEFQNKVAWRFISQYQKLPENFIREFQDKVYWEYIRLNKDLQVSDKFCEEFDDKLNIDKCWIINNRFHRTLGPAYENQF
jgi:hypothetical protein